MNGATCHEDVHRRPNAGASRAQLPSSTPTEHPHGAAAASVLAPDGTGTGDGLIWGSAFTIRPPQVDIHDSTELDPVISCRSAHTVRDITHSLDQTRLDPYLREVSVTRLQSPMRQPHAAEVPLLLTTRPFASGAFANKALGGSEPSRPRNRQQWTRHPNGAGTTASW
jgi:hypothetical protein